MANVSRPAQGNNSKPRKPARPAYRSDAAPVVVSSGSVSRPKSVTGRFRGTRLVADATPRVVSR